jgi:hypothetical protein
MDEMEIIKLSENNIENEHICCAIYDKKCSTGYNAKKLWRKQDFKNGYTFIKLEE